jgi:CDP-diacylglycerol--serine O-phosphatidyltransferase
MRGNRFIRYVPNLITIISMLSGILVLFIVFSQKGEAYRLESCFMILIAVIFDAFDGKIARTYNVESALGKQLDSFADFVSFGLAPIAILLTHSSFRETGYITYICFALYSLAAAFRLARFNTGDFSNHFLGLPITAAGLILIITNLIIHYFAYNKRTFSIIPIYILICILAILMMSNIKIKRLSHIRNR